MYTLYKLTTNPAKSKFFSASSLDTSLTLTSLPKALKR